MKLRELRITGNLHINIVAKDWSSKVEKTIEPWIYEATGMRLSHFELSSYIANLSTMILSETKWFDFCRTRSRIDEGALHRLLEVRCRRSSHATIEVNV